MKRTMTLLAAAVLAAHAAHAQYVTYNHDSPKQNQITVMETGAGSLSPDLYYLLLHNKYKKTAAAKNKLSFRTQQVQEDGGGEEQAVVPHVGRGEPV